MGIVVRAVLYGVNTALHFWISDYMRTALNINDSFQILISYSIIAVTGPLGGVLASSFVSFFLGGYEHRNSAFVLLGLHFISCIFGLAIPFMANLYSFCGATALYLIFNSAALPIVQGLVITSVSPKLKGTAFSIANLVTMLLTSGPAPYLYGMINDLYKEKFKGVGMLFIMVVACVGLVFIFVLSMCRYHVLKMQDKNKLIEKKKSKHDIATDIAGAVNEASIEMNCSIDKSREGLEDDDEEEKGEDIEMKTKE